MARIYIDGANVTITYELLDSSLSPKLLLTRYIREQVGCSLSEAHEVAKLWDTQLEGLRIRTELKKNGSII